MIVLIYGGNLFATDMLWGFLQIGHDAQIINPTTKEEMDKIFEDINPDLLITLGPPLDLNRSILKSIGQRNSSILKYIHWDTDGISSKTYSSISGDGIEMDVIYLSRPDIVFTICPEMLSLIRNRKIRCEILNYAYSPISHYPIKISGKFDNFINIIGQAYLSFALYNPNHFRYKSIGILVNPLLENNYRINFYGDVEYRKLLKIFFDLDVPNEWFNGYLPYEKTCEVYNNSFINLVTQNHENTLTKRTFEILGSGGFMISSDNKAIRQLFTPGKDLEVSSSPQQTLELVEYYKNNLDAYNKIRENALISAQNHTYKQRAEYIVSLLA